MLSVSLTVYFDDPYWAGVFERRAAGKISAARVVFGSEPKDYDVYRFLIENYYSVLFSQEFEDVKKRSEHSNPKRAQRTAAREIRGRGVATRSQTALKEQREINKTARKIQSREEKEAEEKRRFMLKQYKKKMRRRGK